MVIYTRQSVCAPIRAEEGITGILCPPNSPTSFANLAEDQQIGGYPTLVQLSKSAVDATTIDSEGRCVILEFPAFVLLGVYSPANRDESRDEFRLGFLSLLDARIRNLVSMGKRVILTGDLNISREELDSANADSAMRKAGLNVQEYLSVPSRRLFNQLIEDGNVVGEKDKGREEPVLWDVCRGFHPGRKGMFTCWEQRLNARPGNCGSRIDYVLSSLAMKNWFSGSNIQEGLMVESSRPMIYLAADLLQGSDHCPVYATMHRKVEIEGKEVDLLDIINPPGVFLNGSRCRNYSSRDILPSSGRLIPEFDGRRSIRQMFSRGSSTLPSQSIETSSNKSCLETCWVTPEKPLCIPNAVSANIDLVRIDAESLSSQTKKRAAVEGFSNMPVKRAKSSTLPAADSIEPKGQQSLKGFFKPKATFIADTSISFQAPSQGYASKDVLKPTSLSLTDSTNKQKYPETSPQTVLSASSSQPRSLVFFSQRDQVETSPSRSTDFINDDGSAMHDPIESKDSWSKLFTKPTAPRCEGHNEPCITLLTKKNGMNCGRSFWMCSRPLGPTGAKEKNTQWRCQTFIWCSEWNSHPKRDSPLDLALPGR